MRIFYLSFLFFKARSTGQYSFSYRCVLAQSLAGEMPAKNVAHEIDFMRTIRHVNVVMFFGAGTFNDGAPFLVGGVYKGAAC